MDSVCYQCGLLLGQKWGRGWDIIWILGWVHWDGQCNQYWDYRHEFGIWIYPIQNNQRERILSGQIGD